MSNNKVSIWAIIGVSLMFGFFMNGICMALLWVVLAIKQNQLDMLIVPASFVLVPANALAAWMYYTVKRYKSKEQNGPED